MGLPQKTINLKKRLLESLERVSENDMQEIFDFVEFILNRRYKTKEIPMKPELDPTKDPVLKLMGIADAEPFSKEIDRELYGQ